MASFLTPGAGASNAESARSVTYEPTDTTPGHRAKRPAHEGSPVACAAAGDLDGRLEDPAEPGGNPAEPAGAADEEVGRPPRRRLGTLGIVGGILLGVVVAAALVIGAHHGPSPRSRSARLEQIAGQLRCPSCVDESAAVALTPAAAAIRSDIAKRLRAGQSAHRIMAYMVSRYGQWILLDPRASGADLAVWAVPALFAAAAAAVVGVAYHRARRRRQMVAVSEEDQRLVAEVLARWPDDEQ